MRIAFLGTAELGAQTLAALAGQPGIEVEVVVTQPDRPAGRGRRLASPPVAAAARELGLRLRQPETAGELEDALRGAERAALVAYGRLIREPVLSALPFLNLHPSALPRWRGAAPVERAIMAGDAETAVSVIRLVEELDAGPVLAFAPFPIGERDDAGDVFARAVDLGAPLLADALLGGLAGDPQVGEPTYARKIEPGDRAIDWTRPAAELDRQVRGLAPHIGARTALDGRPATIWRARPLDEELGAGDVRAADGRLVVGAGEGALEVEELQVAGGRRMAAADLLRGLREPPRRTA